VQLLAKPRNRKISREDQKSSRLLFYSNTREIFYLLLLNRVPSINRRLYASVAMILCEKESLIDRRKK
jgi:hypothetical protein